MIEANNLRLLAPSVGVPWRHGAVQAAQILRYAFNSTRHGVGVREGAIILPN